MSAASSDALSAAFALTDHSGANTPSWLTDSWADPAGFYRALLAHLAHDRASAPKSRVEDQYDLYNDMVARHLGRDRDAFRWHDPTHGWRSISFEQLDARCRALARSWSAQGVTVGSVLGVVHPFDLAGVTALLTGVYLGACISLLPPIGDRWLQHRLDALAPAFIASAARYDRYLGTFASLRLDDAGPAPAPTASAPPRSHSYASGEGCALLFSPLRPPLEAVPVTSDALYLGCLRDGLVTLSLGPGARLAAPGFHVLQHQPALLFATLLAGATYVELPLAAVERDPALLAQTPLRTVGVCNQMRDLLRAAQIDLSGVWQHWFRNPEEPLYWSAWNQFVDQCSLSRTYVSTVLFEAAGGGALLSSRKRSGGDYCAALMNVWPAAARPWALLDANGSGQEAVGESGVLALLDREPPPTHFVLAQVTPSEYLYGGTLDPRRAGRVYPAAEVIATLADNLSFATEVSVVPVLAGGRAIQYHFVLLIFTGDEDPALTRAREAERARVIADLIGAHLGDEFLPDRTDFMPRFARRTDDGAVDHDWCRAQYLSGALFRTVQEPAFQPLTALRGLYRRAQRQAAARASGDLSADGDGRAKLDC